MPHNLSNLEVKKLFEAWGFVSSSGNGGHLRMDLNGKIVQITAPGRSTATPVRALKKGADAVGVTYGEFLQGPTKDKPKGAVPEYVAFEKFINTPKLPSSRPEEPSEIDLLLEEFRSHKANTKKIYAVLSHWPNIPFNITSLCSFTGLEPKVAAMAAARLVVGLDDVVRPKRGEYMVVRARSEMTFEVPKEGGVETPVDEIDPSLVHTMIHTDIYGRRFLVDYEDHVWIAIQAEPGFLSFPSRIT